jgi:hypothetical protein
VRHWFRFPRWEALPSHVLCVLSEAVSMQSGTSTPDSIQDEVEDTTTPAAPVQAPEAVRPPT